MDITINKVNETHIRIDAEPSICMELHDHFSFTVPGHRFTPAYKIGKWNGKIHLFNLSTHQIYLGLISKILAFAKEFGYSVGGFLGSDLIRTDTAKITSWTGSLDLRGTVPRDYQIAALEAAINSGGRSLIISPTGCHAAGDKILMSDGSMTNIENIKLGDYVIGADGNKKEVLRMFHGHCDMYEICPKNNKRSITVTPDHILPIKSSDNKKNGYTKGNAEKIEFISVRDYIEKSKYYKHCSKIFHNDKEIHINDIDPETLLSPYFIGLYLGDGSSKQCQMTTMDKEIEDETKIQAALFDCRVSHKGISLTISKKSKKFAKNPIFEEFKKLGLNFGNIENGLKCHQRFVPKKLFNSTINFRYELLAGLLDSDGHLNDDKHYFEFVSKSKQLSLDVENLAISLGLVTTVKEKYNKKYSTTYYQVVILGNTEKIPTRIPRKKAEPRNKIKLNGTKNNDPYRTSFNVIKSQHSKYYGIEVTDHLYITNSGMITHNSGKTWIAYLLYRWYSKKTLIIVPTVGLCSQSSQDFIDYGCPDNIQVINEGKSTDITCNLVFATWQSIFRMPKEWFRQFEMVIGDECHLFAAKSLVSIMEKLDQCPLKFGMTGTLDDSKINGMVLEGLFGPVFRTTTTAELIEKKVLSNFRIECLSITYPEIEKKFCKEFTYAEELDYIVTHPKRNKLICNLTQKLKGNTIVLFQFVEKHGKELYEMIKKSTNRPVYYISGEVKGEERERLRKLIETQNDVILVASVGTSSVGLNLISLTNIVFASPSKSKIRTLQSIGRVLRRSKTKTNAVLWDISDDLCWKSRKNYTFRHFMERVKIYAREQFDYKLHKINL